MDRMQKLCDILKIRRRVTKEYNKYLSTPREYYPGEKLLMRDVHILIKIGMDGLDNVSSLVEQLNVTNGAVSQYLSKMEKKGFVERIQDKDDKRQYSVRLTEKGKALYLSHTKYDKEQYEEAAKLFEQFTDEELDVIRRFDEQFTVFVKRMNE